MTWREHFERIFPDVRPVQDVKHRLAIAMVRLLGSDEFGGAKLVSCRCGHLNNPDADLLLVEVSVSLGQRQPVNDIRFVEPFAILFTGENRVPSFYPIREDFPSNLPHVNLAPRDQPRSLCLFELPVEEALRIATPLVLLERTRLWLVETAYGRLHGDDQPLDPLFVHAGWPIVLPSLQIDGESTCLYSGHRASDRPGFPVFLERAASSNDRKRLAGGKGFAAIAIKTQPLVHGRLRTLPETLGDLVETFEELGVDLLNPLRHEFRKWIADPSLEDLLRQTLLLIVRTPVERSPGEVDGEAVKAFMTASETAEEVAAKIGGFHRVAGQDGNHIAQLLGAPIVDWEGIRLTKLAPLDVHFPFSRAMAQVASGVEREKPHEADVTLIGAGALGSQIASTAARMGLGIWTIVDPDHLMPHNLARHALSAGHVGAPKAEALAYEMSALLGAGGARSVVSEISTPEGVAALADATLAIDASASVPVSRWLASASGHLGRTASTFLNPVGDDLVILAEGAGRQPRLDHIEMAYYWMLSNLDELNGHLGSGKVGLYPSGGCRQPSLAISQARIGSLAPIAAKRLLQDELPDGGFVEIWRSSDDGLKVARGKGMHFGEVSLAGWTLAVSEDVIASISAARHLAGMLETGGILVGACDRVRQKIYVVGNYDAPPDSVMDATGFVRGLVGVHRTLSSVESTTGGNLTYVGEWHTHPDSWTSLPSKDDQKLLRWIDDLLSFSDIPPIMAIGGEDGVRVILGATTSFTVFGTRENSGEC